MASMNNQKEIELFEGQSLLYMQLYGYLRPMCLKWAVQLGKKKLRTPLLRDSSLCEVWERDVVRSLTRAYAKRLFPDSNP